MKTRRLAIQRLRSARLIGLHACGDGPAMAAADGAPRGAGLGEQLRGRSGCGRTNDPTGPKIQPQPTLFCSRALIGTQPFNGGVAPAIVIRRLPALNCMRWGNAPDRGSVPGALLLLA